MGHLAYPGTQPPSRPSPQGGARLPSRLPFWLAIAAWILWPPVGRYLFRAWFPGTLVMRAGPAGQDTEYLVHTPLEYTVLGLLVASVPVAVTLFWWRRRRSRT